MATGIGREELRAAVPPLDGTVRLAGLDGTVEIVRDGIGVPHIRAGSVHDLFLAQGFVHAQDRLWQMEYDRRRAAGRWAEYVGQSGVAQDTLMRRLGLVASAKRDYEAAGAETRAMLDAYAVGVNRFVETTATLPIEYRLVGGTPEPWEPWQAGAIFKVRHALMGSMAVKLWRLHVLKALGPEWVERLRAGSGEDAPLVVPPGATYRDVPDPLDEPGLLAELALGVGDVEGGSNNWAVHGSRAASGLPLLAGDPHRALDVPNVYYQNHLACPEFDAIGYSFAGMPGLPHFGHNEHVAWGVTHATADYQDLFVERFADGDPSQYDFKGEWRTAARRRETIEVRGAASVEIDAWETHHGPIVLGDPARGTAVALRYTATADVNRSFDGLLPQLRARTVADLDASMRHWVDPANNFVMADRSGTIGYLTRGMVPVRVAANRWLPVPGWTGEHEWRGTVPFEEMPRAHDPEQGFIATANQRIVGQDFPHFISLDWAPPHRAMRVVADLQPLTEATIEDMARVHADVYSIPSRAFVELARALDPADEPSRAARARLLEWDGEMGATSAAAAIYAVWREEITQVIVEQPRFAPLVAGAGRFDPLPAQALPVATRLRNVVYAYLLKGDTTLLPEGESWEAVGARALARACSWLGETLGPDPDGWAWGQVHGTRPRHPLSAAFPEAAEWLDPPAVGFGGDNDTPQAAAFGGADARDFAISATSVTRYAFDLGDWERSGWAVPHGGSGHPGSAHHADQLAAWADRRLHPMPFARERVEAAATARQRLEPTRDAQGNAAPRGG